MGRVGAPPPLASSCALMDALMRCPDACDSVVGVTLIYWTLWQAGLLAEAEAFRDANIVDVSSYADLKAAVEEGKWARGLWAGARHAIHCSPWDHLGGTSGINTLPNGRSCGAMCCGAGSDEDEKRIKEETTATLRCIPFHQPQGPGACFLTGAEATEVAIFAKAY